MKIPKEYLTDSAHWLSFYEVWEKASYEMSIKYGVPVSLAVNIAWPKHVGLYRNPKFIKDRASYDYMYVDRIFFQVGDHDFENLNDLCKALENKVFL